MTRLVTIANVYADHFSSSFFYRSRLIPYFSLILNALYVDKIVKLRDNVNDSLRLLSAPLSCDLSFPSYHGYTLNTMFPVTADEARKVLSSLTWT